MVRSDRSAAGTVEQAATPVTATASAASRPRNINPSSSAVDRASVFTRQLCTMVSPSKVASTVFVLPMSMQSSTVLPYRNVTEATVALVTHATRRPTRRMYRVTAQHWVGTGREDHG